MAPRHPGFGDGSVNEVYRLKVPDGWLVYIVDRAVTRPNITVPFSPDPEHE